MIAVKNRAEIGISRWWPPLPSAMNTRRSATCRSPNRRPRTSQRRRPPRTIAATIAWSRWVRSDAVSASTSSGVRMRGRVRVVRTSGTPCLGRCRSRRVGSPRGTGLVTTSPRTCRNANNPETLDNRRRTVRADTPRDWSWTGWSCADNEGWPVRPGDVLGFMTAQRTGQPSLSAQLQPVQDQSRGVSARTVRRRLSSVSGLFAFLHVRGDVVTNPVPRGLPTRRERQRPRQGVPLVRTTRTLPRILAPDEVDALTASLRTHRDQAMVAAMVLGGLRRCEVLGLRLGDLHVAERRVFIAEGKGGHQRLIPISARFFTAISAYLEAERPA